VSFDNDQEIVMKIGWTMQVVSKRIAQQNTGSPHRPITVWTSPKVHHCRLLEGNIHDALRRQKKVAGNGGKEWFHGSKNKLVTLFNNLTL
jgi:T5orf172 domain